MLPVIALVGRPNVGKSTLFNQLTRTRDALVADVPGLTRDRRYGYGRVGPAPYLVVDTGGLSGVEEGIAGLMARQTMKALDESDRVLLMVDARTGITTADEQVAALLRRRGDDVRLVVNKAEGMEQAIAAADFHALGLGQPLVISAVHGDNIQAMMEDVLEDLAPAPGAAGEMPAASATEAGEEAPLSVAVIGRPNVGKSTLINRLLGEERLVAFDQPGTTRDSVVVPFERDGRRYELIDTAGIRRRRSVSEAVEKFSIIKALQSIDQAQVVIPVLDASEGVTDQDASLLGLAVERGRAMVIAVNKWDGLPPDQRQRVRDDIARKLPFVEFARVHTVSARHGTGVGELMASVEDARRAAFADLPTPDLTRVLEQAVAAHAPPMVRGRRIKLRYAHQGGRNPPVVVIHGNQTKSLPDSYRRYLVKLFREAFGLHGTPVRLELRSGVNPYAGRRNRLTPRQERKRARLKSKRRQDRR